jgi:ubiquinone/menaquinone biosynthesis C-methylase UbiE
VSEQKNRQTPVSPEMYTEEYFRTACEGFDEFNETEGERLSRRLSAAFALAEVSPGMKVLDVGCGRGEIVRHCARLGADAFGVDYAPVAMQLAQQALDGLDETTTGKTGIAQADAKILPFADASFDRVLMFDIVEHLHPWELDQALGEVQRVLKDDGRLIIHTAPNVWYDRYAYPVVRRVRLLTGGDPAIYPEDPRQFLVGHNTHVHVNEQSMWSLSRVLKRNGFDGKVWLESPPQNRNENLILAGLRKLAFGTPPLRWFFEREVFAVALKSRAIALYD